MSFWVLMKETAKILGMVTAGIIENGLGFHGSKTRDLGLRKRNSNKEEEE